MKNISFSIKDFPFVFLQGFAGKSLPRTYLNLSLKKNFFEELNGDVIDLGAKDGGSSYYKYLSFTDEVSHTYCDYYCTGENVKIIDLENHFKLENESFDSILCFNTIEHVFNTDNLLSESNRILNHGGRFIGCIPFLYPYHADPDDYHRYTKSALCILFEKHGFKVKKIAPVGSGPFALGFHIFPYPPPMRAVVQSLIFLLDLSLNWYSKRHKDAFTLLYLFEAEKI